MNRLLAVLFFASAAALLAQQQDSSSIPVVDPGSAAKPPSDAVILFDGKDTSQWTTKDGNPAKCEVDGKVMACKSGVGDIVSKPKFRSAQIHLEFNPPIMADKKGQLRGNSGVYLHALYEIQILDSFNNPTYANGSCGALYGQAAPLVNVCRKPGEWQSYDIIFHAPKCGPDESLMEPGTVTVLQNGVLVQDHVKIAYRGKGCVAEKLSEPGPLLLQDHSGFPGAPVTVMRFRNIWFRPIAD